MGGLRISSSEQADRRRQVRSEGFAGLAYGVRRCGEGAEIGALDWIRDVGTGCMLSYLYQESKRNIEMLLGRPK